MKLLLLSNSRNPGGDYLAHALGAVRSLLGSYRRAWFVPFASVTTDWDQYTDTVRAALAPLGLTVTGAHERAQPDGDEALFVGGGNTFQLLSECRRRGHLPMMRGLALGGRPYAGWSAGANLACPSIRTTNDMPIVDPVGFDALELVSYQINPHFTTAAPPGHQGETREQRLTEFVAANPGVPVLGLPEGDWIAVGGNDAQLCGPHDAVWFRHGHPPTPVAPGPLVVGRLA